MKTITILAMIAILAGTAMTTAGLTAHSSAVAQTMLDNATTGNLTGGNMTGGAGNVTDANMTDAIGTISKSKR